MIFDSISSFLPSDSFSSISLYLSLAILLLIPATFFKLLPEIKLSQRYRLPDYQFFTARYEYWLKQLGDDKERRFDFYILGRRVVGLGNSRFNQDEL